MDISTIKKNNTKGAIAGTVRVLLAVPLYLILTPYTLNKLGSEAFGLWSFNSLIINFITLTDFGFKNSLVHHVAKDHTEKEKVNSYFNITFFSYFFLIGFIWTMVYVFSEQIATQVLKIPEQFILDGVFVLNITALSFGLRFLAAPYQALIEAYQKIYFVHNITLLWLIFNFTATLLVLNYHPNVYALGFVSVFGNALFLICVYLYVWKNYAFVKLSSRLICKADILPILKYGAGIHGATVVIAIREPIYKILISQYFGLHAVAVFEVANRLCTQIVSIVNSPTLGTFSVSALLANRQSEFEQVIKPLFGFTLIAFLPISLFIISFSNSIITAWLGEDQLDVSVMLPILFLAYALYYITEPLYKSIQGTGGAGYSSLIQALTFIVNISVLSYANDDYLILVPISLLLGFLIFSFFNFLFFRVKMPLVQLISFRTLIGITSPFLLYLLAFIKLKFVYFPLLFVFYLLLHMCLAYKFGLFDFHQFFNKLTSKLYKK